MPLCHGLVMEPADHLLEHKEEVEVCAVPSGMSIKGDGIHLSLLPGTTLLPVCCCRYAAAATV